MDEGRFLGEVIYHRRKKKGKSKVLSRGFCLFDSEAEQRALQFLHIYCSNVNSYCSAPESNKQNLPDRTKDLPVFFRYRQLKTSLCPHQVRVSRTGFRATLRQCLFWITGWKNFFCLHLLIALNWGVSQSNWCYYITKSALFFGVPIITLILLTNDKLLAFVSDRDENDCSSDDEKYDAALSKQVADCLQNTNKQKLAFALRAMQRLDHTDEGYISVKQFRDVLLMYQIFIIGGTLEKLIEKYKTNGGKINYARMWNFVTGKMHSFIFHCANFFINFSCPVHTYPDIF